MSLKGNGETVSTNISFFMNEAATRGGIVVGNTSGSGIALDQANAVVTYSADPSGKMPIGMLLSDVKNIDLTRQRLAYERSEVNIGQKVPILTRGWRVTNSIEPSATPSAFSPAYVGNSGNFTSVNKGAAATPLVGRFLSTKDEDGYATVEINLP